LRTSIFISPSSSQSYVGSSRAYCFKYLTISDIDSRTGTLEDEKELKGFEAPNRARMHIKENDILVPYLSGSRKAVTIVPSAFDDAIATTGFYVLRPKEIVPEYLFLIMRSKIVQLQIEQKTSGAIMTSINKSDFEKIKIPIPPKKVQDRFGSKVREVFTELRNSEKIKKDVEEMVINKIVK